MISGRHGRGTIVRKSFLTITMVRIQIMSDLHLEQDESYNRFEITQETGYLALLGNVGNLTFHSEQYQKFLEHHLRSFKIIFYVLGPKEEDAKKVIRKFGERAKGLRDRDSEYGEFVFLDNSRYDLSDENITILGATMFTNPPRDQMFRLDTYYRNELEIRSWTSRQHIEAHLETIAYLSREVDQLAKQDPERSIIILTHHCPTLSSQAIGRGHKPDVEGLRYRFAADLKNQHPWAKAENVKLWAFRGTCHNCDYFEWETGRRIYSNQRGYPGQCRDFKTFSFVDISTYDDPSESVPDRPWTPEEVF
ncbi:hypothetical protein Daesc_000193 [Daldinia eschscholtzii]|uniref:Calcineurin-like phosphoesterase domain-containing protein n=1 Tax=Daldinia eschscholtzii TaxID=292717 RepID=A0AAX6MXN7_9PEZI